jgi:hypothetical protein
MLLPVFVSDRLSWCATDGSAHAAVTSSINRAVRRMFEATIVVVFLLDRLVQVAIVALPFLSRAAMRLASF